MFDFKKMLDPRGNTAVYLIYAYVRICSILRKSKLTEAELDELAKKRLFKSSHPDEQALASMAIKFYDVTERCVRELVLNEMTNFIFEVSSKIQENYKKYKIVGNEHEETRILLCLAVKKVLLSAFNMVGITPIEKI